MSTPAASIDEHRPLWGVAFMVVASLCFAGMGACVKAIGGAYSPLVIVFARSVVSGVLALALLRSRELPLRPTNLRMMLWRCATGMAAMTCYYYAISHIALADAVTLQFTSPLFVALFAGVMVGERVSARTVVCMVVALVGAALIVAPTPTTLRPEALVALFSAVLAGFAYLAVRELRRSDAPETVVAFFSLFTLVFSAPFVLGVDRVPTVLELTALLGVGLTSFVGQLCLTYAYRYAEAAFVAAFQYSTVLFSAVFGFLFFAEVPLPGAFVGAALIVGAGLALTMGRR